MGEYTSTVRLIADVSDAVAKLNEVKAMLDAMKEAKIKVSFESKDLKDLNATIKDVSLALKDLKNDTGLSNVGNASEGVAKVQELQTAITGVQDSLKTVASKNKNSGLEVAIKQLDDANTSASELENTLSVIVSGTGNNNTSNSTSKNLEKDSKSYKKSTTSITKALNGLSKMVREDELTKNIKAQSSALKEYAGIQTEAYEEMEKSSQSYLDNSNKAIDLMKKDTKEIQENQEEAKQAIEIYDNLIESRGKYRNNEAIVKQEAKNTGFKTITEQAKEAAKATEQADIQVRKSVQSMIDAVSDNKYKNTINDYNQDISPYLSIDSSAVRDEAQAINELNDAYSAFIGTTGQITSGTSVDTVLGRLTGAGYNGNAINDMAKQMTKDIPNRISEGMKTIKNEYNDLVKAQTDFEKGLTNGTYLRDIDNIGKNLGDNKNLEGLEQVNELLDQQAKYYDLIASARENMQKNGGNFNAQQFMAENNLTEEQFKNLPKDFKNSATAAKELNNEFKQMGINASDLSKITSGEMRQSLNDLENSISKMPDSYAKANLNGLAQDMERLYASAKQALGEGTATGYAKASQDAAEFTQKAKEANQEARQFASVTGASSAYGGGAGGGGGGGNIFMGGLTSGNGGSGGNWFSGFATDFTQSFNSAATYLNRFMGYNAIYREARQAAQEMVETVKEVDTAMNQLQIVTGASEKEMDTFFESSVSQAKDLGQSVTDVLDTIQVYSRLGYDLADSSELAEYTAILSNVADVDIEEATTGLTSVIKGFDMEVSDAEHVADVLINIGQNYAVSASEILEAFTRSSAAFGATGTTFEEASAVIAAGVQYIILLMYTSGLQKMQSNRTHLIARIS